MKNYVWMESWRKLKEEHKHLEMKGIMHVLPFPKVLKNEWIWIILIKIHNMTMQLNEPIRIAQDIIHMVTGCPITKKVKAIMALLKK